MWASTEILDTKMVAILDLVNKSQTYVDKMYFIGFVDPKNINLNTKSIFLAGLEIEISRKLDLDTVAILKNAFLFILFIVWKLFERITHSNIFSHIKFYKIKSRNLICQT